MVLNQRDAVQACSQLGRVLLTWMQADPARPGGPGDTAGRSGEAGGVLGLEFACGTAGSRYGLEAVQAFVIDGG